MSPAPPNPEATREEPGALAAVGAVLLAAALAFAVIASWSQPSGVGQYNLGRAHGLLSERRYTEAAETLEGVMRYHGTTQARLLLSEAYLGLRQTERALTQADLARRGALPHMRAAAWLAVGRAHAQAERTREALDAWEQSRASASPYLSDPQVEASMRASTWRTASLLWSRDGWDEARPYLERLAEGRDTYALAALLHLAQLHAPSDSARSKRYLNNMAQIATPPETPSPLDTVPAEVTLRERAGALMSAHDEAGRAPERNATETEMATLWGSALLQQGEYAMARRELEKAVRLEPANADALTRLAVAQIALGETDKALENLQNSVRLKGNDPLSRRALAGLLMARREWLAADMNLQALERLQPSSPEPRLARAEFLTLYGDYEAADEEYDQAASLERAGLGTNGNSANASLAAARYFIEVRGGDRVCNRGLPHAQFALQKMPRDPAALDMVGWALALCGRPDEGVGALERAVELSPYTPRYRYHLARAYRALGRPDDALHQLTRVLDLDSEGPWSRLAITEQARIESER
jgi:tetratricopeptide (TPR) repeat protein